jgi:alpha-glucosidase
LVAIPENVMTEPWWKTAVIYQIYPRSLQDSDGDGVGDLPGIIRRLPYLAELGVDALWVSPIFPSPMKDFGYDVCDYTGIDPLFGTVDDFDALLAAAHAIGLKLMLDFIPNHTSDRHPWFVESRSSPANPRRDWYIWRDPARGGAPPNNWLSEFGGSAWTFDQRSGQYYYHAFLAEQPDLNWRNPEVRAAMHDVMRFWLRKGVDGFRVDVMWHLIKDDQFRDNPINRNYSGGMPPHQKLIPLYTTDLPEVHEIINGLRRVIDEFPRRLLIGEIYLPIERLVAYYGRDLDGAHLPFNFALLHAEWNASAIGALVDEYEAALPIGGWPNWVLGNHDRARIASRVGRPQARIAAMLLLTLRGTPTLYYGDEIGMRQVLIPPDRVRDPFEKNVPGIGVGRDGARTPMQWDTNDFAGFSTVEPWLPVSAEFRCENVESDRREPSSIFNLYRRLISTRRQQSALSRGSYRRILVQGDLLLYVRKFGSERTLVALNLGCDAIATSLPWRATFGTVLVSCFGDREGEHITERIDLRGNEGLLIEIAPDAVPPSLAERRSYGATQANAP